MEPVGGTIRRGLPRESHIGPLITGLPRKKHTFQPYFMKNIAFDNSEGALRSEITTYHDTTSAQYITTTT